MKLNTLSPDWEGEQLALCVPGRLDDCVLMLRMWDQNKYLPYNDYMGSLFVPLSDLLEADENRDESSPDFRAKPLNLKLSLTKEPPPLQNLCGDLEPGAIQKRLASWKPSDLEQHGELGFHLAYTSFNTNAKAGSMVLRGKEQSGVLFVNLHSAKDLKPMDLLFQKADPMVYFTVGSNTQKSRHKKNTLNPRWRTTPQFVFHDITPERTEHLQVQIYDYEHFRPARYMGGLNVDLASIIVTGKRFENFELADAQGSLRMELVWLWS